MTETACDILIVGGGTGGCAAAIAAASLGCSVILTEETDWVGGQLTSQAVPPDEHPWIEQFGCTYRYRKYRDGVRAYYRAHRPLTEAARATRHLNPGGGWVSRLCHEPKVGLAVLEQMIQESTNVELRLNTVAIRAETEQDEVRSVMLRNLDTGDECVVHPKFVLDATELGDLLPMTGTEYVIGAESKRQTGEPNAVEGDPEPENVQGLTWVFAMAHDKGSHRVIDKPAQYDRWSNYRPIFWPGPFFGFTDINPQTGEPRSLPIFGQAYSLFTYRQIVDPSKLIMDEHPVTIVNWPQNDYFEQTILDVPADSRRQALNDAKQLSLSLLYWLQTEAPRHDGGVGYPGLYLRPDITGTEDGFAKSPYIRESRRILARFTVLEQLVAAYTNPGLTQAPEFQDSVGIGAYRIDLHPSTNGRSYVDTSTLPFQIPLGSLIPVRIKNLLPACKNLGVSHIANGCYRLHPVEWNIGESTGLLAAYCLNRNLQPHAVVEDPEKIRGFQQLLTEQGVELAWPRLRSL